MGKRREEGKKKELLLRGGDVCPGGDRVFRKIAKYLRCLHICRHWK